MKYYYVNDAKQVNLGLVKIDGDFYYVCYSGKLKQNGVKGITEEMAAKYGIEAGTYYFGEDCKIVMK